MNPLSSTGSVDISLQLDNREERTATKSFVGVGSPNPLLTHQRPFQSVNFPKSTFLCRDMNLDLQSTIDSARVG